jgi:predicted transposase YbfD/YdcC
VPVPGRVAQTVEKGHGRIEKRKVRTTTILTMQQKWAGLKQGIEITRERTVTAKGETTVEVVYGITSLSEQKANAERLLELTRGHWGIENGLHHVRDVTLKEDASRVRAGSAPQVMAALRNVVVYVLGREISDKETRTEVLDRMAARPTEALQALDLPPLE